jgi:hypothetical protein
MTTGRINQVTILNADTGQRNPKANRAEQFSRGRRVAKAHKAAI